jgi:hypothetical protein
MPRNDPTRRKSNVDAWRATHLEHVSRYNHQYYTDNRARILQRRDELKRRRFDSAQARVADLRANASLTPSETRRELEAGLPLGGLPPPSNAALHGERRWMERALRGTPFKRRRPGRTRIYFGSRKQRHAAAQKVYRAKLRAKRESGTATMAAL